MKPESSTRPLLIVNPGSTSTKVALSDRSGTILERETIRHSVADLRPFTTINGQLPFRLELCLDWFAKHAGDASAAVGIGGLLRPVEGGVYRVNDAMLRDARNHLQGEHASNLGCQLAHAIGERYGCPSFVVDPVSVDEFEPLAYYSGHPLVKRRSLSHALNIHAAARQAAQELKLDIGQSSFVIGHLGGGISIAPVRNGRIIDVNDAASDGPFSPERTGGLPLQEVITLAYSGKYSERELRSQVMGNGGMAAYLGTNSVEEVWKRIAGGDGKARLVFEAMAYQVAKEIGAMATVLGGRLDAIVLTGGITCSTPFVDLVTQRVRFIAPVLVYPGEDEMRALAQGAANVVGGIEDAKEY